MTAEQTTEPEPLLYHNGQPFAASGAAAKREALMSDPEYTKAALAGDLTKTRELANLLMLSRGQTPPAASTVSTVADVEAQAIDRAGRERDMHAASMRNEADYTPEQINQIVNQRPVTAEERAFHQRQLVLLKKDVGFVRRYLDGDAAARLKMGLHHKGAVAPLGSLAEIQAWETAHPMPAAGAK
jgi:hypothetical protein